MMNALKHMELIFGAVLAVGCIIAALPDDLGAPARQDAARVAAMPVVVIKGKRMTAVEKRQPPESEAGGRHAAADT
jgi:hypothetical protein